MCEYCGCQDVPALEELTREHDAVLGHVRAARAEVGRGDLLAVRQTCAALGALLGPHTAVEEQALFPAMAREHPGHVGDLVAEHALVEAALREVAGGTAAHAWDVRLLHALDVLSAHVFKEQDGLFPAALSTLSPAEWDAVDAVRLRVGSPLG